jgi:hypothetical protein
MRKVIFISLIVMHFVFSASDAEAFTHDDVFLFKTADDCLWGEAQIENAAGVQSSVLSVSTSLFLFPPVPCSWLFDRPAGWLATDILNYHWNGNSWDLCADSGWLFNQSISSSNSYSWNLGLGCGSGWYGTYGGVFVWRDDRWQGGWVWSGSENLIFMTFGSAEAGTSKTPPPPPPWVRIDGSIDMDTLPARIDVVGRDGIPTGLTVDPRELLVPPAVTPGTTGAKDPSGVERTYLSATSKDGTPYGVEHVRLTEGFRPRIGLSP